MALPYKKRYHFPGELALSFRSGEQRVLLGCEIAMFDREIRKQAIRRDHPDWSQLQVMHEIFRQAFLPKPVPEGLQRLMRQREEEERALRLAGLE